MWICMYTHPLTSTHTLYMLFSWKPLLTWFTVYAADAVSVVHAVLMEMLVNTEPWKLLGFSYSFHFWYVWGIISISLERVAFWGQSLRLQRDTFRRLRCRLKRHKTLLQVMYGHVPLQLQVITHINAQRQPWAKLCSVTKRHFGGNYEHFWGRVCTKEAVNRKTH